MFVFRQGLQTFGNVLLIGNKTTVGLVHLNMRKNQKKFYSINRKVFRIELGGLSAWNERNMRQYFEAYIKKTLGGRMKSVAPRVIY